MLLRGNPQAERQLNGMQIEPMTGQTKHKPWQPGHVNWGGAWVTTQSPAAVHASPLPVHPEPMHMPALQVSPAAHALPQLPQFAALVWVSTQAPPQFSSPPLHMSEQEPMSQT